jgi:ribonuclease HII
MPAEAYMRLGFDPAGLPPEPDLSFEQAFWRNALSQVGGIDEAGRGALAGPVAAAVVVLPPDPSLTQTLSGVRDSKQMTPHQRERWAVTIRAESLTWKVAFASAVEIDALGILPATRLAAQRALDGLSAPPQHLLLDYLFLPDCALPQTSLVKGDRRSLSIAAASVLAKTARDTLMCALDSKYPGYGFSQHKGYGTLKHRQSIQRLGPCAVHRRSFKTKART